MWPPLLFCFWLQYDEFKMPFHVFYWWLVAANIGHLFALSQSLDKDMHHYIMHRCGRTGSKSDEELEPCPCDAYSAVVHPSCAVGCKDVSEDDTPLQPRGTENTKQLDEEINDNKIHSPKSRGTMKYKQDDDKGMKRAWISSNDQIGSEIVPCEADEKGDASEPSSVENSKLGKFFSGHWLNDVLSTVPIKKRKFHLQRSPSPPPLSPSPRAISPVPDCRNLSPSRMQSPLSSRQELLEQSPLCHSLNKENNSTISTLESLKEFSVMKEAADLCEKGDGDVAARSVNSEKVEPDTSNDTPSKENNSTISTIEKLKEFSVMKEDADLCEKGDGGVVARSIDSEKVEPDTSDDRLHWDLNTDMEAWNTHGKETSGRKIAGVQLGNLARVSVGEVLEHDREHSAEENFESCVDGGLLNGGVGDVSKLSSADLDHVGGLYAVSKPEGLAELLEEPELDEVVDYDMQGEPDDAWEARSAKPNHVADTKPQDIQEECVEVGECVDGSEMQVYVETKNIHILDDKTTTDSDGWYNFQEDAEVEDYVDLGVEDHENDRQMQELNSKKHMKFMNDGWDTTAGEAEVEERLDYGDSDCRDADDNGFEVDEENIAQDDGEDKAVLDVCYKSNMEEDHSSLEKTEELQKQNQDRQRKIRRTGWDQLPEGFDNAEEALKAAKENSGRRVYGGSWSGSGGRGFGANSHSPLSGGRFGSGRGVTNRADGPGGEGHCDEFVRGRACFNYGRGFDDDGRNTSRRPMGSHGRGDWIDSSAPGRRSTSGFDNQGPQRVVRGAPRLDNGRCGRSLTNPGSARGVLRSMIGSSSGGNWEPPVNRESGRSFGKRMPMRDDRGMLGSSPNSAVGERCSGPGRGSLDGYQGPCYGNGKFDVRRESTGRLASHLEHPTLNNHVPSLRSEARMVQPRTSPSHYSSTRSPPSKWSRDRREAGNFYDGDGRRSHVSSVRVSSHVVHGSFLMDERDHQVLSGSRVSPSARGALSSPRRARSGSLESRHSKRFEDIVRHGGSYSRDRECGSRDSGRNEDARGDAFRRERDGGRRQNFYRPFDKEERPVMGHRHSYSRDGDDITARRQRHS